MANIHSSIEGDLATDLLANYKKIAADRAISLSELADELEREAVNAPGEVSRGHLDVAKRLRAHAELPTVDDKPSDRPRADDETIGEDGGASAAGAK